MKRKSSTSSIKTYLMLVKQFPLHAIRCPADAAAGNQVLLDLVLSTPELAPGERNYVEALNALIQHYESSLPRPQISVIDRLKHLMSESGLNISALGKIIGSQPEASMALSGKRELSKEHIRRLAAHFKLDPGYFMQS